MVVINTNMFKNTNKTVRHYIYDKPIATMDQTHKEITDSFKYNTDVLLPQLNNDIDTLRNNITDDKLTIDELLDIRDKITDIKKRKRNIQSDHKKYLLTNSEHIFNYFKHKKNIDECNTKSTILGDFFKVSNESNYAEPSKNTDMQMYMSNVNDKNIDISKFIVETDKCPKCLNGEMISIEYEGIIVCNLCSLTKLHLVDSDKPSFKEPPKEVCFYAYKRINHFREILAQFQAKESTNIHNDVMENIIKQVKKERIVISEMTNKNAKDILKKLGYNKFYEHIPFIKDKLGIRPPIMSAELENLLCSLFSDIQAPYAKYCPGDRTNFLNYHYTIYKLCELLDQRHFLPYFPMLKDHEKRIEQDTIWKLICEELDWEFIPTI